MPNMEKVRRAIELRRRKKALNAQLKTVNAELEKLDESLMSGFLDEGVDSIKIDGVTLYPMKRIWAGLRGEREDAARMFLASPPELGLRGVLTANSQSLSKVVRDRMKAAEEEDPDIATLDGDNLIKALFPLDLAGHISAWTKFTLGARGVSGEELGGPCAIEGCWREHHAMGLCSLHYGRQLRARRRDVKVADDA